IAGYAVAGRCLQDPKYVETAARAADFVLQKLRTPDGRLLRTYGTAPGGKAEARLKAYLDDYAYLVHGLLCLHDATNDKKWLDAAKTLTDKMVELNADAKSGGFFYTANDHEKLFTRSKDQFDGAQPSGNSVAARNLVRLVVKTGDDRYRTLAEKSFKAFAATMQTSPGSMTAMAEALAMYLDLPGKR
ncbi:MAG TPA: AGE family epimerase/isomerase, partial [Gemmataceae bacterium]|nr:AGE family epimerase/isomerase [Gemmataceae bacterium]